MMYRRKVNSPIQQDSLEITREYHECVKEIRDENGILGSLALHHEAMRRLALRQHSRRSEEDDDIGYKASKRPNVDFVATLFRQESLDHDAKTNSLDSAAQFFRGDDDSGRSRFFMSRKRGSGSTLSHVVNRSIRSFMNGNVSMNSSMTAVELTPQIIRRRESNAVSGFDDAVAQVLQDLELSDSDENEVKATVPEDKFTRRNSLRRGSLTRNSSAEIRLPARRLSRPRSHENNCSSDDDPKSLAHATNYLSVDEDAALKNNKRRSSLFSLDEDAALNDYLASLKGLDIPITGGSPGSSFKVGSLICGWGRSSFNSSIGSLDDDGDTLICDWGRRGSMSSNSTSLTPDDRNRRETKADNLQNELDCDKRIVPGLINLDSGCKTGFKFDAHNLCSSEHREKVSQRTDGGERTIMMNASYL